MSYTRDGIMAQVWIAFGQGTGAIRVSQEAALELHRWYYGAITDELLEKWDTEALQVLDRIRAIGSLSAMMAIQQGSTKINAQVVYESSVQVQLRSDTPYCPPPPPLLP